MIGAFIIACLASPAAADIRIRDDFGGRYDAYSERVEAVRRSGERIIIDGRCYPACTLWPALPLSQICVTRRDVRLRVRSL